MLNAKRLVKAMINGIGIVGFRDPHGIRPLVFGTRQKITEAGSIVDHVLSSESVVMDMLGFHLIREYRNLSLQNGTKS